ncbi:MAG: HD domain-containing protein [Actinomycetota bacterium]|nr:HD domain-containing protein [Actinomycetota bacterium]
MTASIVHLAVRFLGSLRPGGPARDDEQWALTKLTDGERALWRQMSNPDRRHAVGVAQMVAARLWPEAVRPVLAAALLHDVGKVVSGLRTPARVVATLVWAVVPSERATVWCESPRTFPRRLGQYHRHPELGEQLLVEAGADPTTSTWAADHHRPTSQWRVAARVGSVLKDCDGD